MWHPIMTSTVKKKTRHRFFALSTDSRDVEVRVSDEAAEDLFLRQTGGSLRSKSCFSAEVWFEMLILFRSIYFSFHLGKRGHISPTGPARIYVVKSQGKSLRQLHGMTRWIPSDDRKSVVPMITIKTSHTYPPVNTHSNGNSSI